MDAAARFVVVGALLLSLLLNAFTFWFLGILAKGWARNPAQVLARAIGKEMKGKTVTFDSDGSCTIRKHSLPCE